MEHQDYRARRVRSDLEWYLRQMPAGPEAADSVWVSNGVPSVGVAPSSRVAKGLAHLAFNDLVEEAERVCQTISVRA